MSTKVWVVPNYLLFARDLRREATKTTSSSTTNSANKIYANPCPSQMYAAQYNIERKNAVVGHTNTVVPGRFLKFA